MLAISDEHKEAIIRLINAIVSDSPVITNLTDRSKVSQKLVKLIHFFEHSVNSGNKSLLLLRCVSFEAVIENWLLHYYHEDSVMDSFDIEEGVEQELSTASLLILYVIFKFTVCFPHIVMYFNDNWNQLQEFNTRLDQMLKMDKIVQLLYQQLDGSGDSSATIVAPVGIHSTDVTHDVDDEDNDSTNGDHIKHQTIDDTNDDNTDIKQELMEPLNELNVEAGAGMPMAYASGALHLKPNTVHTYSSLAAAVASSTSSSSPAIDELILPHLTEPSALSPSDGQSDTGQTYVCAYCHRSFGSKYKLKRHEFVHKPLSKPFQCPWNGCDLRFRSSFDMRRHLVTHTGERPFGCDHNGCGKRFSRADKLKEHKLVHEKRAQRLVRQFNGLPLAAAAVATGFHTQNANNNSNNNNKSADELTSFTVNLFDSQVVANLKTELNVQ